MRDAVAALHASLAYALAWLNIRRRWSSRVRIALKDSMLQVWENGKLLFEIREQALPFDRAYLYLQMSSHSNYPAREVFFDDLKVEPRREGR